MSAGKTLTPKFASRGRHRDRSGGREKTLFSFPAGAVPTFAREEDVLASFAYVFTVDTNTIRMRGENVSVATIAVSTVVPNSMQPGAASLITVHPGGFEFHGLGSEQERLAWVLLQDAITGSPDFDLKARYLLITDHAKSQHPAINSREEPLFGEAMLAPNIELGFATSDSGNSICQRLVRSCDTFSTEFLRDLRSGKIGDETLKSVTNGPITKLRGIENLGGRWPSVARPFRLDPDTPMQRYELS
jgi:hypothetical protein